MNIASRKTLIVKVLLGFHVLCLLPESKKKQPNWIIKSLWTQLLVKWGDIKCIQKCETNQKNRNSDVGITLHTGGSIPITEHIRRYEEKHGVSAGPDKMYLQTHTKKEDGSFVTPKLSKSIMCVHCWLEY
ncbi:unnamed protein product [Cuscuta epithymum]|nr:unnamed protein product [Cuscuta epithymum]